MGKVTWLGDIDNLRFYSMGLQAKFGGSKSSDVDIRSDHTYNIHSGIHFT